MQESARNKNVIQNTGLNIEYLRGQWAQQKVAQLSVWAYAPKHLKKELDSVLNLQAELDTLNTAIDAMKQTLKDGASLKVTLSLINNLTINNLTTTSDIQRSTGSIILSTSLAASQNFSNAALTFFFEWDKLDQAVGGHQQSLVRDYEPRYKATSTNKKGHHEVQTCPSSCYLLAKLHNPVRLVPLPEPLPTQLSILRDAQSLMEDIWITPSEATIPQWLEDLDVCNGIRAMHKVDRCAEEHLCLHLEAKNMCQWLASECATMQRALVDPQYAKFARCLETRWSELERLEARWSGQLIPRERLNTLINSSQPSLVTLSLVLRTPGVMPSTLEVSDVLAEDWKTAPDKDTPASDLDAEETVLYDLLDDEVEESCTLPASDNLNGLDYWASEELESSTELVWRLPVSH
ncbi:hypothetical protein BDN71DRAFT_1533585 [Pleurotus eryngii]|uniref:Uncharacterized protein n=1 Tax=Pleurotus eryngii TaxID=5323 RepID=A0A9P5ZKN0_PLEER|nr:hypothetical protein BDN71DRAFT_1533585 [Pleurotus eryngii]